MALSWKTHTVYDEAGNAWTFKYAISSITNDVSEFYYYTPSGSIGKLSLIHI